MGLSESEGGESCHRVEQDAEKLQSKTKPPKPKEKWGKRHTFVLLGFLGFANMYAMRANLSVAIVAMVNSTTSEDDIGCECDIPDDFFDDDSTGEFDWDAEEQGVILGAFYYGYIATQIPGGYLAEKYGGKWVMGLGLLTTAIFTLLTPVCAEAGKSVLIVARVIEGLGEGVAMPAMQAMISKWTPLQERSFLAAVIYAGTPAGNVISLPLSGILADSVSWESVFYVFGAIGVVWFVFWIWIVADTPAKHSNITKEELVFIEQDLDSRDEGSKLPFPPLSKILTSIPFLALLLTHFGQNYGFYTLLTETPTYLNNIQHYDLTTNGFLSALPYGVSWILSYVFGYLSNKLLASGKVSIGFSRKLFNSIAFYGPALGLTWLGFVGCSREWAIVALCVSVGLNAGVYTGFQINHVDLSPNYSGTLFGITNMIANINGIVAPLIVGIITNDNQTIEAWRLAFLIAAATYAFFNTIFLIFGSGEVQDWNTYWKNSNKIDNCDAVEMDKISQQEEEHKT